MSGRVFGSWGRRGFVGVDVGNRPGSGPQQLDWLSDDDADIDLLGRHAVVESDESEGAVGSDESADVVASDENAGVVVVDGGGECCGHADFLPF